VRTIPRALWFLPSILLVLATSREASATDNVVVNPSFNSGLGTWKQEIAAGYTVAWTNAVGAGAYEVTTSAQLNHVTMKQCLNALPGLSYSFGASYRISSAFGEHPLGGLGVAWTNGPNCSGEVVRIDETPLSANLTDTWLAVGTTVISPYNAKSVSLSVGVKTSSATTGRGYFDDVYFVGAGLVKGDANGDGLLDVSDVFYLINFLYAHGPLPYAPVDVNSDTEVNAVDVFYMLNYLFAKGPAPK
jgi:hypothetical protein